MLEARFGQGLILKKVFEAIKEMVTDVNLECNEAGIQLQAMDSSNVSLVSMELKESCFDFYRCDKNRTLGLNMTTVAKVFKLCGNDDAVILRHEDDGDTVSFVFENASEDRLSEFEMKLMQIEQEHLGVPESDFQVTVELPSADLKRICGDLSQFADTVMIETTNKHVKFSTRGEIGGGGVLLKPKASTDKGEAVTLDVSSNAHSTFALRYLNLFSKASSLSPWTRLQMSTGQPIEVMFSIMEDESKGTLKFYLAPKMDGDHDSMET